MKWLSSLSRFIFMLIILLLIWALLIKCFAIPNFLLPAPYDVLHTFLSAHHVLWQATLPTLYETLFGFIFGVGSGIIGGLLIAYNCLLKRWFLPLLIVSQAIPTFAIAPFFILWLGFGITSKIAVSAFMIFFPVTSAFYDGLVKTHASYLELAKSHQASHYALFRYVKIPAALPSLASGIKIAAVVAPIGAIVGEWVGASQGLVYLMLIANARMQIELMFCALFIVMFLALCFYFLVDRLLTYYIWWK